jgi:hypothetical protein
MSSLDNLPADQRAVLEMVLKRGRSYAEIANLLRLDPAVVRERAQIALDSLGPHTGTPPVDQHRIADYLLGQLPDSEAREVRDVLADSPGDRAWARVVASALAPVAGENPLPEIPTERSASREPLVATVPPPPPAPVGAPRSSRVGGALLILVGVVAVAAVLFFVLRGKHSSDHTASTPATTTASPAASATSTTSGSFTASATSSTTPATSARVVTQINLTPPASDKNSRSAGIAEVLNEGSSDGVAIVAQNVPPNTIKPPNAYAVWLYNSSKDAKILGFVNPGVGKTGRLSTAGPLPSNASHYKQLIVTVETTGSPKVPGPIILQGAITKI